jgi:alanine racemase
VKADGYGHGVLTVARAAVDAGAQWLGTTDLGEACALRAAGFTVPILSWLNPFGIDAGRAVADGIDIAVGSVSELEEILVQGVSGVRLHLYADTGMAREACPAAEWPALVELARRAEQEGKVRVVGVMG